MQLIVFDPSQAMFHQHLAGPESSMAMDTFLSNLASSLIYRALSM